MSVFGLETYTSSTQMTQLTAYNMLLPTFKESDNISIFLYFVAME
jgi:hypothetical protein